MTSHKKLQGWVEEMAALCEPDQIRWCDGSEGEYNEMFGAKTATRDATERLSAVKLFLTFLKKKEHIKSKLL